MLRIIAKPHREFLRADTADQRLFVMFRLQAVGVAAKSRPPLALALVVDTSGSMHEVIGWQGAAPAGPICQLDGQEYVEVSGGETKIKRAIQVAERLIHDPRLKPEDQVSIIQFDDSSSVLADLQPAADKGRLSSAVRQLSSYEGGTMMARGLRNAIRELSKSRAGSNRKVFLLTDGHTFDEPECRRLVSDLRQGRQSVISLGVGDEYNEDLLMYLAEMTHGVWDHLQDMTAFQNKLDNWFGSAAREVVTDVELSIRFVQGFQVLRLTRIQPSLAEITLDSTPYLLGSVDMAVPMTVIAEILVPSRPPSRVRIAQASFEYWDSSIGQRAKTEPLNIVAEFTHDEALTAQVDAEVMEEVAKRNVWGNLDKALRTKDVNQAMKTLQLAKQMTMRLGNTELTQSIERAEQELKQHGTISLGTAKTVKADARTKTMGGGTVSMEQLPSEEEIRKITGT